MALLLSAVIAGMFLKKKLMQQALNLLAWIAFVFIVMACPPFSLLVDFIFLAAFAIWFVTSQRASASQLSIRRHRASALLLVILLVVFPTIEFSQRRMPRITGRAIDHIVVLGDSISSGIDPKLAPWPDVLQQMCAVEVRNLARPGALVSDGLMMARSLKSDDHLVLVELGGNDLLMGVPSDEYGKSLDTLLSKMTAPDRTVLMFELPLLPNNVAYGRIQRRLSSRYGVQLIPKLYFAQVIGDRSGTTDGLHLSASGSRRMAAVVAQVLSPRLKSCDPRPNINRN